MLVCGMMAVPTVLLNIAATLCLLSSHLVQADYIFEVNIQSYSNPTNREADGDCCDDLLGDCDDACEHYYNLICLRPFGHPHDDISTCSLGSFNTDIFVIPRTVSITGTEPWPVSFQLYIEVFDEDSFSDDLLDRIFADDSRAVSDQFSSTQFFLGDSGWVTLGLQFRVQCAPGWDGSDCDVCMLDAECSTNDSSSNGDNLPFLVLGATDGVSKIDVPTVDISGGFPFGDVNQTVVYVVTNGYFSFGRAFSICCPSPFHVFTEATFIVAPFWGDVNIANPDGVGRISYEVHTSTSGGTLLQRVSRFISGEEGLQFSGTWMLVAEWYMVPEYGDPVTNTNTTNTFQGVLITDGRVSYTVFIYECGRMEWSGQATIGFNTDGTFFVNHPLSGMDNTSEIACLNAPETVWSNVVYQIASDAIIQIGLSEIDYSVTEDEGQLEVCAEVINGVLETDLTVAISSSAQDAIPGSDYTDISVSLTFLPGSVPGVQECTQIEIIDDQLVESNEAFTISLSSTDTEINLAPGNGSVTILDNDVAVQFVEDTPVVNANESSIFAQFEVQTSRTDITFRMMCALRRLQPQRGLITRPTDCSDGTFSFSGLAAGLYSLKVKAIPVQQGRQPQDTTVRAIRIPANANDCVVNFINSGVEIMGNDVTITFSSTGTPTGFTCSTKRRGEDQMFFPCASPLRFINEPSGRIRVTIAPNGCQGNPRPKGFTILIL